MIPNIACLDIRPWTIGDGYCDDDTNNEDCLFDGGDCCGYNVITYYCTECFCHHIETCSAANVTHPMVGNSFCDDETNNVECNFDGGDCCGTSVNMDNCLDCACHEETGPTGKSILEYMSH